MKPEEKTKGLKWTIDPPHSEISFRVKHLMITNVKGVFKEYDADIRLNADDHLPAYLHVTVNSASVYTGDQNRDNHLRSADFFDVENFTVITFEAVRYEKNKNEGNYTLYGDLTIKGIKKPVELDVEFEGAAKDPWGNEKAGYLINGKINRKDWDLNWNAALEAGGVLVGDEVRIICEVQLVKQK
jgi:polyisoprenoid-binding protein YceI